MAEEARETDAEQARGIKRVRQACSNCRYVLVARTMIGASFYLMNTAGAKRFDAQAKDHHARFASDSARNVITYERTHGARRSLLRRPTDWRVVLMYGVTDLS